MMMYNSNRTELYRIITPTTQISGNRIRRFVSSMQEKYRENIEMKTDISNSYINKD